MNERSYSSIPSPCFVLEENLLRKNLSIIKDVADRADVEIILAFKGFSMWSVFPIVRESVTGATASSLHEAQLCLEEMKTKAHYYAAAIAENEFDEIAKISSHISFNSLNQFHQFRDRAIAKGISCGIRVNPEFSEVKQDLYNPASPTSRLGMTSKHFGEKLPDGMEGIHFHCLFEDSSFTLEKVLNALEERFGHLLKQVKWVNMGGGHLITRKDYDVEHLITVLKKFKEKWNVHVILEPGSAFAWQTGFLISTVLDIVENGGAKTAMLDTSFTAHMPDCLEMPYKPVVRNASSEIIPDKPTYRLGGMSCLSGDFMSEYSFDKELKVDDQIIFEDMIHYTMVKTTTFNGVKHPSIGMIKSNGEFQLIKEFGYEDYKNRLS